MKAFTSKHQRVGKIGEDVAARYLVLHGYSILERNFTRKWGEIDIVALRDGVLHFVEVKSVSCESPVITPEDNMTHFKRTRMKRIVESYLSLCADRDWTIDLACVSIDMAKRVGRVRMLKDVPI